jgi:hypothetical protein
MAGTSGTRTTGRKRNANRPNRAQMRAAEIRARETVSSSAVSRPQPVAAPTATVVNRRGVARPVSRAVSLTPEAEMDYVRTDLRRLMYTAGVLFVAMITLLIVLN